MLTATHQHALLKTKAKKLAKLERKNYCKYALKFNIRTSFHVLEFDIHTLYIEFEYVKRSTYIEFKYVFRVMRQKTNST
jgi:hypothetical protein